MYHVLRLHHNDVKPCFRIMHSHAQVQLAIMVMVLIQVMMVIWVMMVMQIMMVMMVM